MLFPGCEVVDDAGGADDVRVGGGLVGEQHAGADGGGLVCPVAGGLADCLAGHGREIRGRHPRAKFTRRSGPPCGCFPVGRHGPAVGGGGSIRCLEQSGNLLCSPGGVGGDRSRLVALACRDEVFLLPGE